MTELLNSISNYIDLPLAFGLIGVGICIKHIPLLEKVQNKYIPTILIIVAVVVSIIGLDNYSTNTVISSILGSLFTAAVSIGLHQQAKPIFNTIIRSCVKSFAMSVNNVIESSMDTINEELIEEDNN